MGPKTTQLLTLLDEIARLLRSVGEDHWAVWLEKDAAWIRASDAYGVAYFLQAFGGMGSLNDVYIHPVNRHPVTESDAAAVNERLREWRRRAYELAEDIRREADIE